MITFISSDGLLIAGAKMRAVGSSKRKAMPPVDQAQSDLEIFAQKIQDGINAALLETSQQWDANTIALALRELGSIAYREAEG